MNRVFLRRDVRFGVLLFALLLAVYGGVYALWQSGHQAAYLALTRAWGIDTWGWPFFDLQGVLSWAECHRLGVDVLQSNPCDPMNRPLNYGPPLLSLPFGIHQTIMLGLALDTVFLAAVCCVLRPRSWRVWLLAAAAGLSTASLFALERGNFDLLEFALVALANAFAARGALGRAFSYALFFLGGMLKFYPFALLLLVLRERTRVAVSLALGFAILIGCYAAYYWKSLVAIAALMPKLGYEEDTFGASLLGYGLADELGFSNALALTITVAAFAAAASFAVWLAAALRRQGLRLDLTDANSRHLIAGAVIVTACFVLQSNITYRAIFLLFLLPGLLDLRGHVATPFLRRIFTLAAASVMFCLWSECLRRGLESGLDAMAPDRNDDSSWNDILLVFFVCREFIWWLLITTAFSLILVFLRGSSVGVAVVSPAARSRTAA